MRATTREGRRTGELTPHQRFVNALRECLGKCPLYGREEDPRLKFIRKFGEQSRELIFQSFAAWKNAEVTNAGGVKRCR